MGIRRALQGQNTRKRFVWKGSKRTRTQLLRSLEKNFNAEEQAKEKRNKKEAEINAIVDRRIKVALEEHQNKLEDEFCKLVYRMHPVFDYFLEHSEEKHVEDVVDHSYGLYGLAQFCKEMDFAVD